jgi:RNA polymerase sigma-70 factor (ECF subfamily)
MAAMATDLELLERWRGGDMDAGNELFERYFTSICRFFENKIHGDAEELVQATFLAAAQNRDQFREQSSFRTYLFSIARYQLYGYYRSRQRGKALDFGVTSLVDLGTSPGSQLARNQEHELLLHALCSLPLEQQLLLELFYWEGMESADLAQVFEIAEATVRTRLYRARQVLRERMAELAQNPGAAHASVADLDAWARRMRDALPDRED